jgi:hypothetical protein
MLPHHQLTDVRQLLLERSALHLTLHQPLMDWCQFTEPLLDGCRSLLHISETFDLCTKMLTAFFSP